VARRADRIDDFEQEIFNDGYRGWSHQQILDAKYAPADLESLSSESKHLTAHEQQLYSNLLTKYKSLFDGTLGKWDVGQYDLELKEPDAKALSC
jgi:hypothetical protein